MDECTLETYDSIRSQRSAARHRLRVRVFSAGQYIHPAFDIAVPYLNDRHEIENHGAVAELFAPLPEYKLQLKAMQCKPTVALPYDRLILMHMAAGGSAALQKSWPAENWLALASGSLSKDGLSALLEVG